ncbi:MULTISPECIES: rod-binding protein [unclassified Helicobacter]|uniref:rod-binding protein n=1 Tax=unclassified Helicobacter TaxID=2593540 RepID=UPI000DCB741B|nr:MULTISPECIES: rod-binding protein [unclassified Helicobacter]MDY4426826.1 rod-binding protein [Helicobacter sp.]MDY5616511.1 rod-binding protein [Helicobacter sp.]RAX51586.1 Rod binding protein [Helicobacter sp. 11-8110]
MEINFNHLNTYSKDILDAAKQAPTIQKTDDDTRLREQTDAFEALIIKNMLDTALKMDDSLYPKAPGHDIYESMYRDTLSESLSGSFGFSDLLFDYLKDLQSKQGNK